MGTVERLWLMRGYTICEIEGLVKRYLVYLEGQPPCAMLPTWARGQCREDMLAGLVWELALRCRTPCALALELARLLPGLDAVA